MQRYNYHKRLQEIWTKSVDLYSQGFRELPLFFNECDKSFLNSIGVSEQEVYDYAEDFNRYGEPDFTTFALIQDIRRSYFEDQQKSTRSKIRNHKDSYPNPEDTHESLSYFPRLVRKALDKLTGSLNPEMMYSCVRDRQFFKEHDIHPAEFLRKAWETEGDLKALAIWVLERKSESEPT